MIRRIINRISKMNTDTIIYAPETYQYNKGQLLESDIKKDPFEQFHNWFDDAKLSLTKDSPILPEATTFSTCRLPSGRVSSRVVLLKELDHEGFVIYSNWLTSKKLQDFASNKFASLAFFWPHLQRQVRVEGIMEPVDYETSSKYFNLRPRGSKVGAWSSPQSQPISDRSLLEQLVKSKEQEFDQLKDDEIKCPQFWGGMKILPLEIEFWQGRNSRLHDRITFTRDKLQDQWQVNRLAP